MGQFTAIKSVFRLSALPVTPGTARKARPTDTRQRLARRIIACSIVLACITIAGLATILTNSRARAVAGAERELRNTAAMLAEQSSRAFESLTLVEDGLIQRIEKLGVLSSSELRDRLSGYDAHVMLRDTINGLPHVESVAVFDSAGDRINSSRLWPSPRSRMSERDDFKSFINDRGMSAFLSEPEHNRRTGAWLIFLGQKFFAPNGEVIGIVSGAIKCRSLEQAFSKVSLGSGSTISLHRRDGVLLASYPPQHGDGPVQAQAGGEGQLAVTQEAGQDRLKVSIVTTMGAALAGWWRETILFTAAAVMIILVIAYTTSVALRQLQGHSLPAAGATEADVAHKATELVLRETERVHKLLDKQKLQLDTVLDNMLQGVVMLDADARIVVCNQRYLEIYGMSPEIVKPGCTLREIIKHRVEIGYSHGDIDETVAKILATLAQRKPSTATAHLSNGLVISVFTQPMAGGGWVVTHQDVTKLHRAQSEAERTERFLLTVIEHVPSTVIVKEARDLRYVLINRAGEKFYGLPRARIIGHTAAELFSPVAAAAIAAQDKHLLEVGGGIAVGAQMVETPANGFRHVMARRLAIRDAKGTPQFLLTVIDDLSERKSAAA